MDLRFKTVAPNLTLERSLQKTPQLNAQTGSLGSTFEKMLMETNQLQMEAQAKKTEFLTSEKKDIHGTMVALEKAEVSLRMLLQVRNKLTTAYEEVMRMQV